MNFKKGDLLIINPKFGTHINSNDNTWINLYADYQPVTKALNMLYFVDSETSSNMHPFVPNEKDKQFVISLIENTIKESFGCSALKFAKQESTQL